MELVELADTNVELSTVVLLTEFIDDVEVETGTDVLVSLVKLTGGWLEDVDVALLVVVIDVSVEKSDEALVEVSVEELVWESVEEPVEKSVEELDGMHDAS